MSVTMLQFQKKNSFKFKIPDLIDREEVTGEYFKSPQFCVTDVKGRSGDCVLKIYPNGRNEEVKDYISIFLQNRSSSTLTLNYTLRYLNKDGVIVRRQFDEKENVFAPKKSFGILMFARIQHLKGKLPSGDITLVLEFTTPWTGSSPVAPSPREIKPSVQENHLYDIQLVCQGQKFPCHKQILALKSPMFRNMFCETNNTEITLLLITPQILKEMLSFIYCGKTDNLKSIAIDLMKAAVIFQLDDLKEICSKHLRGKLNTENILDYLDLAEDYNVDTLRKSSLDFVVDNISSLMKTARWNETVKGRPRYMARLMEVVIKRRVV